MASQNDESRLFNFFQHNVSQRCSHAGALNREIIAAAQNGDTCTEEILVSFNALCLPYSNMDRELPVAVIVTNHCVHLLRCYKGERSDYEWMFGLPLTSLRQVALGLFDQSFRIEASHLGASGTFTILTRDGSLTSSFVETIRREVVHAQQGTVSVFMPPDVAVLDRLHNTLSQETGTTQPSTCRDSAQHDLVLYKLLFEVLTDGSPVARTLIVTSEGIFLCDEDLVHWPLPTFVLKEPATPQYVVLKYRQLHDLANLELSLNVKYDLFDIYLVFDDAKEGGKEMWHLRTSSQAHQQMIVDCLKRHWRDMYNTDLAIAKHMSIESPSTDLIDCSPKQSAQFALDQLMQLSSDKLVDFLSRTLSTVEQIVYFVQASFMLYTATEEFSGCLILTSTTALIIATRCSFLSALNSTVDIHCLTEQLAAVSVSLTDFVQVTVSLLDQYVRIEGNNERQTFSCLIRDSQQTGKLVTILKHLADDVTVFRDSDACGHNSNALQLSQSLDKERSFPFSSLSNIKFSTPTEDMLSSLIATLKESTVSQNDIPVVQYTLLYELEANGNKVPRSLVLTDEDIFFLNEDYVHYPVPSFCRSPVLTDQFKVVSRFSIRSLKQVEFIDFTKIKRLGLVFAQSSHTDETSGGTLQESEVFEGFVKVDIDDHNSELQLPKSLVTVWIETGSYSERETLLTKLMEQYNAQLLIPLPVVKAKGL